MLNARVRASALAIFALAFCLLPIGAAVACEVCPPTDCHEQVVRHAAPPVAVQPVTALPVQPAAANDGAQPPTEPSCARVVPASASGAQALTPLRL